MMLRNGIAASTSSSLQSDLRSTGHVPDTMIRLLGAEVGFGFRRFDSSHVLIHDEQKTCPHGP